MHRDEKDEQQPESTPMRDSKFVNALMISLILLLAIVAFLLFLPRHR